MSSLGELRPSPQEWVPPLSTPLDQAVWNAWLAKGLAQEAKSGAAQMTAVMWGSAATLVATAALWSQFGPYMVFIRFIVLLGGMALMVRYIRTKQYAFAAVFGLLALIYNPIAPLIDFTGDWQRAFAAASAAPFIAAALSSRVSRTAGR